ncbi:sulfite exporter TauE/SafE family protein, partial [Verrucomicrobiota bacterium]
MDIPLFGEVVKNVFVGLVIGFAIGMTGVGGGAVVLPALIHVLGISPVQAVGTGLVYAMITKLGGAVSHIRLKTVRPRRSLFFLLGGVPGVLVSSRIVNVLSGTLDVAVVDRVVQFSMALLMVAVAVVILVQTLFFQDRLEAGKKLYCRGGPFPARKKVVSVVSGVVIGMVMGATSIGGGVLILPVFMLFLNASAIEAVGSSIVISLVVSGLGGGMYLLEGNVRLVTVLLLCVGSVPGEIREESFGTSNGAGIPA